MCDWCGVYALLYIRKWITRTTLTGLVVINQTRANIVAGVSVCARVRIGDVNEMYCEHISIFLIEINEDIPCDIHTHTCVWSTTVATCI